MTAGLGLVINPRQSFYDVCNRFNIKIARISEWVENDASKSVYSVTGWEEIQQVLLTEVQEPARIKEIN